MNEPSQSSGDPLIRYRIDAEDRILSVNQTWCDFARENGGADLLPPQVIGRSLWEMIADQASQDIYSAILKRVRSGTTPVVFPLRCDSPRLRRHLKVSLIAGNDGEVEFVTELISAIPRAPLAIFDATVSRTQAILSMCGWCHKMPTESGQWLEAEVACARLGLFERADQPALSHGICPECSDEMLEAAGIAPARSAS